MPFRFFPGVFTALRNSREFCAASRRWNGGQTGRRARQAFRWKFNEISALNAVLRLLSRRVFYFSKSTLDCLVRGATFQNIEFTKLGEGISSLTEICLKAEHHRRENLTELRGTMFHERRASR